MTKVFCSGCFDMLHSGHVAFFEEAAEHGDLYIGIGSDRTLMELKGRTPVCSEEERLYMVKSIRFVKDAWISSGTGLMDFEPELRALRPDVFFVNEDGHNFAKKELCDELGIAYRVSRRKPHGELPVRSTTSLRGACTIPYRLDLAGGWLDQPHVSRLCAGPVLTICIEPDYEFNDLAGMATSTRKKAIELWQTRVPPGDREALAKTLFCIENPPGRQNISGSQDSLGIVLPGLNRLDYNGDFWPEKITSVLDNDVLRWLERHLRLVFIKQREKGYDVYHEANIVEEHAAALSTAAKDCWDAILQRDFDAVGGAFLASFEAQMALFPSALTPGVRKAIEMNRAVSAGWKMSGAGGGGYLALWTRNPTGEMLSLRIRGAD